MKLSLQEAVGQYSTTEHVSKQMRGIVADVIIELKSLYTTLTLHKPRIVFFDKDESYEKDEACACAYYIAGTTLWPVIMLEYKDHYDLGPEGQFDGIKSSTVHELCHAFLESKNLDCSEHDEDQIENITVNYCDGMLTPKEVLTRLKEML